MVDVLIVEDDEDLLFLYQTVFNRMHLETVTCASGASGLVQLAMNTPGLVILDVNIPDKSGLEIIRYIRQMPHLKAVPIVVITSNDHLKASALDLGAAEFVVKPVTFETLQRLAESLIESQSSRRSNVG